MAHTTATSARRLVGDALTVAAFIGRVTIREIETTISMTRWQMVGVGITIAVLWIALGVLLSISLIAQIDGAIPHPLRTQFLSTTIASTMATSALFTTVLRLTIPARTDIQSLLALLPLSRQAAGLGELLPPAIAAVLGSLVLASPSFGVAWLVADDEHALGGSAAVIVVACLITVSATFVTFSGLVSLLAVLRIPGVFRPAIAGATVISLSAALAASELFSTTLRTTWSMPDGLFANRVAAQLVVSPGNHEAWIAATGWAAVVLAVFLTGSVLPKRRPESTYLPLPKRLPRPRGPRRALTAFEFASFARNPQTIMTVVAAIATVIAVLALRPDERMASITGALLGAAPVIPFALAVGATGRTMTTRWLPTHLGASLSECVCAKFWTYAGVGVVVAGSILVLEIALGLIPDAAWTTVPARCCLALGGGLLAGTLIPITETQPLTSTIASFLAMILFAIPSTCIAYIPEGVATELQDLALAGIGVLYVLGFAAVARRDNAPGDNAGHA